MARNHKSETSGMATFLLGDLRVLWRIFARFSDASKCVCSPKCDAEKEFLEGKPQADFCMKRTCVPDLLLGRAEPVPTGNLFPNS